MLIFIVMAIFVMIVIAIESSHPTVDAKSIVAEKSFEPKSKELLWWEPRFLNPSFLDSPEYPDQEISDENFPESSSNDHHSDFDDYITSGSADPSNPYSQMDELSHHH